MPAIHDGLPDVYRRLLPVFFERDVPVESKATCSECAMCEGAPNPAPPTIGVDRYFSAETKCCTFQPRLPNYLVGAILADETAAGAEGRRRVRERIATGLGVDPLWLRPPAKYSLLYDSARRSFGQAEALLCPFYDRGSCTIWRHREAVCSTFFCRYVAGADGRTFWNGVKRYLSLVEEQLARSAALELHRKFLIDFQQTIEPAVNRLSTADLDETAPSPKEYAARWGEWAGREEDYFRACFAYVAALGRADLERLLGLDGVIGVAVLEKLHHDAVDPLLPPVLRFNADTTVDWLSDGTVSLAAYSDYEAVAVPGTTYPLLVAFTGREPVAVVRQRLHEAQQADVDDALLLTLYRHRVLVEPQ